MIRRTVAAATLATLLATAAPAQDEAAAARAAGDRLDIAATLLDQAEGAQDQIAALTETVRAYEDGLALLRDGLRRVTIARQTLEARLAARSDEVGQLLSVLQTIDPDSAPVLLLHPSGALGAARTGMLLADMTPALQAQVDSLRSDLATLNDLRTAQEDGIATLASGLDGVQAARAALADAVAQRTDLPRRFTENPRRSPSSSPPPKRSTPLLLASNRPSPRPKARHQPTPPRSRARSPSPCRAKSCAARARLTPPASSAPASSSRPGPARSSPRPSPPPSASAARSSTMATS